MDKYTDPENSHSYWFPLILRDFQMVNYDEM